MNISESLATYKVLIAGIYLCDKPNLAFECTEEFLRSKDWHVKCLWASLGQSRDSTTMEPYTIIKYDFPISKMAAINTLLLSEDLGKYDYIIITDDDILLPNGFLDNFLQIVKKRKFALSQPARTHTSFIDHFFVARLSGIESRETNFVEVGPLFCISRSSYDLLLPFDEDAPMGWGLDFVWPCLLATNGFTLGIIDLFPVEHSLRKPVSYYSYQTTSEKMGLYLSSQRHLKRQDAFRIIKSYQGS